MRNPIWTLRASGVLAAFPSENTLKVYLLLLSLRPGEYLTKKQAANLTGIAVIQIYQAFAYVENVGLAGDAGDRWEIAPIDHPEVAQVAVERMNAAYKAAKDAKTPISRQSSMKSLDAWALNTPIAHPLDVAKKLGVIT